MRKIFVSFVMAAAVGVTAGAWANETQPRALSPGNLEKDFGIEPKQAEKPGRLLPGDLREHFEARAREREMMKPFRPRAETTWERVERETGKKK